MRLRSHKSSAAIRLSALLLVALAAPHARAQGDPMVALADEYSQLEAQGLKENFMRRLSYTMLLEYLPPGTRMTSGYRSPEKQLDLIMRMARAKGISTPASASVEDESSWWSALSALRARGYIIASPKTTPHATEEDVFDLAGADLNAIQDGLRKAEKAGLVKYRRIIFETQNNAVHVEIESLSPKLLSSLGRRLPAGGAAPQSPATGDAASAQPAGSDERAVLQQLQNLHDGEPDPAKKIDYDRSMINLLDPAADSARVASLNEEIARHQRDAESLAADTQKQKAISDVTEAIKDERFEDAERAAIYLARNYPEVPEARGMLVQVRTRRLIDEATSALYPSERPDEKPDYAQCQKADKLLTAALKLAPDYEGAQFIREDIDDCLRRGRMKRFTLIGVAVFVLGGGAVGLFFLARSQGWLAGASRSVGGLVGSPGARGWSLEVLDGAGRGQVFALAKAETVVGSKGPPEGAADVVILDAERKISRRHCTIAHDGAGRFFILDESTNGTKINGQPVARGGFVEFRPGDQLNLADVCVVAVRPG